jgi:hypothetical protein
MTRATCQTLASLGTSSAPLTSAGARTTAQASTCSLVERPAFARSSLNDGSQEESVDRIARSVSAVNDPRPCFLCTRPRFSRSFSAWIAVARLTPRCVAISCSDGSRTPGSASVISTAIWSAIWR